jgi:four helix bundle protein
LNNSETEADETKYWLDVSHDCNYIDKQTHEKLYDDYDHILAMLVKMINNPEKWKL